ncbi:MAG: hypothetical protein DHS20C01_36550 [marine bacterium B5-7]|nr:MAG: hypothetical protein DHS20C01_36550 [marine bacterium B5-7]
MPDEAYSRLRKLLYIVSDILTAYGIQFCLDRGTLLGAYRSGTLIPGDTDIDIKLAHHDWLNTYQALSAQLPRDLKVTAVHHESVIHDLACNTHAPWFENADGRFLVAHREGSDHEICYHTATALTVHWKGCPWDKEPNLDLYCHRINEHHDCTPKEWSKPWESDGKLYLCLPSDNENSRVVPYDLIFPLTTIGIEGREMPAPARCRKYLEHIFGYLGDDAKFDEVTRLWIPAPKERIEDDTALF